MIGELLFGLDAQFIDCVVEELEDGETVTVIGCNNPDGFVEYLSDERQIECDYEQKGNRLILSPADWNDDNLPY